MLHSIFDPASAAEFQWARLETIRDHKTTVYSYKVDRPKSNYTITYREGPGQLDTITVAYHGLAYIDLAASNVLRVTIDADGIPPNFPIKNQSILLDYDFFEIAGHIYLLPHYAETHLADRKTEYKNQMQFWNYRKFEANSALIADKASRDASPGHSDVDSTFELGAMAAESWMFPPPPRPSLEKTLNVLDEARMAAARYLAVLPNFTLAGQLHLHSGQRDRGVTRFTLTHSAPERDDYEPARKARDFDPGPIWSAEFKQLIDHALDMRSPAQFRWDHWTMLRGHMTHVYSFDAPQNLHGLMYVDAITHRILRIFAENPTQSTLEDFAFVDHGGESTLIPIRAVFKIDSTLYEQEFERP